MKPNQYHLFTIAVTGMLLIILGLILFGCTDDPEPCSFTVTNNGVCLLDKCTNGITSAFWIN